MSKSNHKYLFLFTLIIFIASPLSVVLAAKQSLEDSLDVEELEVSDEQDESEAAEDEALLPAKPQKTHLAAKTISKIPASKTLEFKPAPPEQKDEQPVLPVFQENGKTVASTLDRSLPLDVKARVKELRRKEKEKFEELTQGFIRRIINEKTIESKQVFLSGGSKELSDCINRAIDVDLAARNAKERVKLSKLRMVKSIRDFFSEVILEMEQRRGSLSGQGFRGGSYHVKIKQPIFKGGELWHSFLKEQATVRASEAEYSQTLNDLIQKVAEAYFDTLRTAEVLLDKKSLFLEADTALALSKKKWEQGIISEIEFLNVESMQSQLAHDVEQANQDYELVFVEMQKYLGLEGNEKVGFQPMYDYEKLLKQTQDWFEREKNKKEKSDLFKEGTLVQSVDELMDLAYANRPDFKLEANRLRANIMGHRAGLGKFLPGADITMEFGELGEAFVDTDPDPLANTRIPHTPEWQAIFELTWNFAGNTVKYVHDRDENAPSVSQFQSGTGSDTHKNMFSAALLDNLEDVYRAKEAEVDMMDLFVKLEDKEREVIKEVKEAYYNFKRAEVQLSSEMKQLLYREKLMNVSKHKLEINDIQASEYLQSQMDLTEEKEQLHKAMADYYVALVGLNRAVGVKDFLEIKKWGNERSNGKAV